VRRLNRFLAPIFGSLRGVVLPSAMAILLLPALALADPSVHLAWDDCGASGVATKTFACGGNAGSEVLVVSFVPPAGIDHFQGIETKLQLMGASPATLLDWWQLSSCRSGALIADVDFTAGPFGCADPWLGQGAGGASFSSLNGQINAIAALPAEAVRALDPAVEYDGLKIVIRNVKTTGAGACGGCTQPIGIMVGYVQLDSASPDPAYIYPSTLRETGAAPYVIWQCSGTPRLDLDWQYGYFLVGWDFPGCVTGARRPTWGAVKSLYR